MYPSLSDYLSDEPLDFDRLRNEVVGGLAYAPSFGAFKDLQQHIDMLEQEFAGQSHLKLVHSVLIVLIRREIETKSVYRHFCRLWAEHGDILLDMLDTRWLVSACDTICDHAPDPCEKQIGILVNLFVNTLKLAETERLMSGLSQAEPERITGRMPLFEGMTAFMPGRGNMIANMVQRLDRTLQPDLLAGRIGREVISRTLSADTVFQRLAQMQTRNIWRNYLSLSPEIPLSPRIMPSVPDPDRLATSFSMIPDVWGRAIIWER